MALREDSFGKRLRRYADVTANVGGFAMRLGAERYFGMGAGRQGNAEELKRALGALKGPIVKLAQMLATIPDLLPPEYAAELAELQAAAPAMGWPFVRRRMSAELGPDWPARFEEFEKTAAAAASLGQVHRARDHQGRKLACKLQYPDMDAAVEADLRQMQVVFALLRRTDLGIDTAKIQTEIGLRLREELNYDLEARHMKLYGAIFAGDPPRSADVIVPEIVPELSTRRLLTMTWLDGEKLLSFKTAPIEQRNRIAENLFHAWWRPFSRFGVIHGDPHLGNYSVAGNQAINLLDYGCIRTFRPKFTQGVIDLYHALATEDSELAVHAFESWGFENLSKELIETLSIWARFIYGPLLDDRMRTIADGVRPGDYGRKEAFSVHKRLRELGPVTPPQEFVFLDRAAIGLGAVFLHLEARRNWYQLFNETIEGFALDTLAARQDAAFAAAGVPLPA